MCHFIWWLTQSLLFTGATEICIFLPLPLPLFHLCSSPLRPQLHSHNPLCLWQGCMKWILPHPAAMILISLHPPFPPFSLHSPLHWFHLSLWARQLGVITHASLSLSLSQTHTHTHIRVFGRKLGMCSFTLKAIKLSGCCPSSMKTLLLFIQGNQWLQV